MDIMQVEILEDGTVSVKTDQISEANHYSADQLLKEITDGLGGERVTEKRKDIKQKHHHHHHLHAGHKH